jgi:hypothetical protein
MTPSICAKTRKPSWKLSSGRSPWSRPAGTNRASGLAPGGNLIHPTCRPGRSTIARDPLVTSVCGRVKAGSVLPVVSERTFSERLLVPYAAGALNGVDRNWGPAVPPQLRAQRSNCGERIGMLVVVDAGLSLSGRVHRTTPMPEKACAELERRVCPLSLYTETQHAPPLGPVLAAVLLRSGGLAPLGGLGAHHAVSP